MATKLPQNPAAAARPKKASARVSRAAPAVNAPTAPEFVRSQGNVFADLGLADADGLMFKAELAAALTRALRASRLKQQPAGELLGWTQPEVSAFINGRISGFSVERIMRALKKMGKQVEVYIRDAGEEVSVAL